MAKKNKHERTLQMMENFIEDHNNGMTIAEISKKYKISTQTVYPYLQKIADKAGIPREELLQRPHKEHEASIIKANLEPMEPIDLKKINASIEKTLGSFDEVICEFDKYLSETEPEAEEVIS